MSSSVPQPSTLGSLKEPGNIFLVSCYELGHQPIGLAQSVGFLEQAGFSPATLDLAVENLNEALIRKAQFIGISVPMHTALTLGVQVATRVRSLNSAAHMCFFGLYASLNATFLLEHVADSVIGGEYETPLLALVERLESQITEQAPRPAPSFLKSSWTQEIQNIPGVSIKGQILAPFVDRLTDHPDYPEPSRPERLRFPIPQRTTLPSLHHYAKLDYKGTHQLVGHIEASRGCLHQCLHCPIVPVYEGRFFIIPRHVILADIQQQIQAGATHITFGDPDFLNGPGHSLNILRTMHEQFPDLTFDFTTKIEHILQHRTLFQELRDLGCLFIVSAVESFSDTVLHHLEKGHTREDIFVALHIVRTADIALRPSLVAFTPWTTLDDYLEMFTLIESHDLVASIDPIQYAVRLLVPPGSALLNPPKRQALPIQQFIHQLDQSKFQYLWSHPDPRMDSLHKTITQTVEQDTKAGIDPFLTFHRLKALAHEVAGINSHDLHSSRGRNPQDSKPPRLTEPWFCCAEPSQDQLQPLRTSRQPN